MVTEFPKFPSEYYVLKGWTHAGDCVLQPAGIVHNELACSDDVEILEIYSPAVHQTMVVDAMPAAAAAAH